MAKFISRTDIVRTIVANQREFPEDDPHYDEWGRMLNYIKGYPTEDILPTKHGFWEPVTDKRGIPLIVCSNCRQLGSRWMKFCPWCGTKMDHEG